MFILKPICFLSIIVLLTGCISTKYQGITHFPKLEQDENILIAQLPDLGKGSIELLQLANEKLRSSENKVFYLPEQEYNLLLKGISKEALDSRTYDKETQQKIYKELNTKYLLLVDVLKLTSKGDDLYGYYIKMELDQYRSVYNQDNEQRTGELIFTVMDLSTGTIPIQFITKTTINPFSFDDEDDGEYRVNIATKERAGLIAFKKGLKKLSK